MRTTLLLGLVLLGCGGTTSGPNTPPTNPVTCESDGNCPSGSFCALTEPNKICKERCDQHYECGTGFLCMSGVCVSDGTTPAPILGPAQGCASGMGYELLKEKSYACPGAFQGMPRKQCTDGFSWCVSSQGARQVSAGLGHFFASAQPIEQYGEGTRCGYQVRDIDIAHYVAGVGGAGKAYVEPIRGICAGWPNIVRVDATPPGSFGAQLSNPPQETDIDNLTNSNPDDGVICCRGVL